MIEAWQSAPADCDGLPGDVLLIEHSRKELHGKYRMSLAEILVAAAISSGMAQVRFRRDTWPEGLDSG